jgi:hypothetical protein
VHNPTDSYALLTFPLPNVPEKDNCNASGNIGKDLTIGISKHLKPKKNAAI